MVILMTPVHTEQFELQLVLCDHLLMPPSTNGQVFCLKIVTPGIEEHRKPGSTSAEGNTTIECIAVTVVQLASAYDVELYANSFAFTMVKVDKAIISINISR
eukprot:g7341.t1